MPRRSRARDPREAGVKMPDGSNRGKPLGSAFARSNNVSVRSAVAGTVLPRASSHQAAAAISLPCSEQHEMPWKSATCS